MAAKGLKVLSYGFKEIEASSIEELMQNFDVESQEFRENLECELTYLGTFGLNDPIREGI